MFPPDILYLVGDSPSGDTALKRNAGRFAGPFARREHQASQSRSRPESAESQLEEEYQPSEMSERAVPKEASNASAQGATVNDDGSQSASSVETALTAIGKYV